jgi:hypothetical protein
MKIKVYILTFLLVFGVVFVTNMVITVLWNYFIKSIGPIIDWETSFRLAILFGIVVTVIQTKKSSPV